MAKNLGFLSGDLRKAMTKIQAESLVAIQAELGSDQISPRDKGRLRSSWFASSGSPSGDVAPEGADSPNTDANNVEVNLTKPAWLSNNLPYADSAIIEGNVTSQSPTWFKDFRSSRIPKIYDAAAKAVRAEGGF